MEDAVQEAIAAIAAEKEKIKKSMENAVQKAFAAITAAKDAVIADRKQLELERIKLHKDLAEERKEFELEKKVVADAKAQAKTFVKLNVGGTVYHTSLTTLLAKRGSMLEVLFSGRHTIPKDDDGNYFLDRDPKSFEFVLKYLRQLSTGKVPKLNYPSEAIRSDVLAELKYLQVMMPAWDSKHCGRNLTITGNIVKKTSGGGSWNANVLGCLPVDAFIVQSVTGGSIMVGLAPKQTDPNEANYHKCGFYINLGNGYVYNKTPPARGYTGIIKANSTVEVKHVGTDILFVIDGQSKGVAFKNVPGAGTLYPSIDFLDLNATIELI